MVRVDPENRCAVMLVYGTKLVVLPFRKDTLTDEQEGGVGEGYAYIYARTHTHTGLNPQEWIYLVALMFVVDVKPMFSLSFFSRPKSSFLPSYLIDVRELDEKLLNIIDMKFLHGYYEPTLLILFEPNQTWPG